tara:strand:+ start:404 stop:592 length:189 start_codon:yes stop_codon:yes gene_type:complete
MNLNYISAMFPYNDDENAWISGSLLHKKMPLKHNLTYSLIFALFAALLSATVPALIYYFISN